MERTAVDWLTALDPNRWDRRVIVYDAPGPLSAALDKEEIPWASVRRKQGVDWHYAFRLGRVLRQWDVDVLHTHNDTALFYGALAVRIAHTSVMVATLHNVGPASAKLKWVLRRLSRGIGPVVAVCEDVRDRMEGDGWAGPGTVRVIKNGVDPGRVAPGLSRDEVRAAEETPADAPVVGYVGRMDPNKNLSLLIEAFALVRERIPEARLWLVGEGPDRAALERQAAAAGLHGAIHFCGLQGKPGDYYGAIDVFAMSSLSEGMPMVILEALTHCLPVVAPGVGGIPEMLGDAGVCVPPGDPDALAAAVTGLLADPGSAKAMAAGGREMVLSEFTLENAASAYESLYLEFLERG